MRTLTKMEEGKMTRSEFEKKLKEEYEETKLPCPKCRNEMAVTITSPVGFGSAEFKIKYSCASCTPFPFTKPVFILHRSM